MGSVYEELKNSDNYNYYSGEEEVEYIFGNGKLDINDQAELCDYLLDKIVNMYNKKEACPEFRLKGCIISYRDIFLRKMKTIIEENLLDKGWIETFTDYLIFKSDKPSMVKLGLVLAEFYDDKEKVQEIINIFSKDGEYVFYLERIMNKVSNVEDSLLKLSKNTKGVIKLFALTHLIYSNDEILKYFIEKAYKDDCYQDVYIDFIMNKIDLLDYLKDDMDEKKLDNLSFIVSTYLKDNNITSSSCNYEFIKEYFKIAKSRGNTLYSLYAIYLLRDGLIDNNKERIKCDIDKLLKNKNWIYIFQDSVSKAEGDSEAVIDLADYYSYQLTFEDFLPYLERNKRELSVYFYIVQDGSRKDKIQMIKYFYNNFNIKDYIGKQEDAGDSETTIDDFIFALVINSSKIIPKEAKTISMLGLFGNKNSVRREAIRILRRYRDDIDEKEWDIIKTCYDAEPNEELKALLEKLIFEDEDTKKEFLEVEDKIEEEHVEDVYLVTTEVSGVAHRYRRYLEEALETNVRFYLVRDEGNKYKDECIKVVSESGYVIGFVPSQYSCILNNMIIGNKYLYAKIEDYELDRDYIKVDIYESYKDVVEAINNTLQMITEEQNGSYIN